MARYAGLVGFGVLLGLVSAEAGVVGIVLSLVAALGVSLMSADSSRTRSGGLFLASSSITMSLLLGRLVVIDAQDPAVTLAPGTSEMFAAAIGLSFLGLLATITGGRPRKSDG